MIRADCVALPSTSSGVLQEYACGVLRRTLSASRRLRPFVTPPLSERSEANLCIIRASPDSSRLLVPGPNSGPKSTPETDP